MASAVLGDMVGASHPSAFHTITPQSFQYSQTHRKPPNYCSSTHSLDSAPRHQSGPCQKIAPRCSPSQDTIRDFARGATDRPIDIRLPSPPGSSSPSSRTESTSRSEEDWLVVCPQPSTPSQHGHSRARTPSQPYEQQPAQEPAAASPPVAADPIMMTSPAENPTILQNRPIYHLPAHEDQSWNPPGRLACAPAANQQTIHIRDMQHVRELANCSSLTRSGSDPGGYVLKYEISAMPISDIIEMVAALLTKITSTNDCQDTSHCATARERNAHHIMQAQAQSDGLVTDNTWSPYSSSVLAFHGKNVPAITILSYLSRIHKYCPTTYEVFLSLLVYFDRMTQRVNKLVEGAMKISQPGEPAQADVEKRDGQSVVTPTYFVVDSYNIHRLIISGVTCSSKFFSDVFYTNSRYAKVGGLPLAELNHLEIQFLLLNDFRLAVPVEDLDTYATMLVEFYTRDVLQMGRA